MFNNIKCNKDYRLIRLKLKPNKKVNKMNANANLFSSNENKALLWSVLHGGGKFNGIPDALFHNVKTMFETTIHEMGESYHIVNKHADLNSMNKEAMITICKKIEMIKSGHKQMQQSSTTAPQVYQKKQQQPPQLQTIYKAEDIHKERQTAFNMELKKKEEEMASVITLRKPDEIKFTDDVYDRPIGDDMERLLAEALASRERELEQLKHVTTATATTATITVNSNIKNPPQKQEQQSQQEHSLTKNKDGGGKEKHVSFGRVIEHHDNNNFLNGDRTEYRNDDNNNSIINDAADVVDADLSSLFSKFKKINNDINSDKNKKNDRSNRIDNTNHDENDDTNANDNVININKIIIKMSQDIMDIKSILTELSERINRN